MACLARLRLFSMSEARLLGIAGVARRQCAHDADNLLLAVDAERARDSVDAALRLSRQVHQEQAEDQPGEIGRGNEADCRAVMQHAP